MNIGGVLGGIRCSGSGDTGHDSVADDLGTLRGVSGCGTVCCINILAAGAGVGVGVATGAVGGLICFCFGGLAGNCAGVCKGRPG
eukprot:14080184-Ditylum_brightwellii.AAC.1